MAKSDSFFIRATVNGGKASAFIQTAIDLGAYVDALGKSVMRIHNIAVDVTDENGRSLDILAGGSGGEAKNAAAQFQLTTQSQTDFVLATNKSVVAGGIVNACNLDNSDAVASIVTESFSNLPQLWTNGYLIAVDTMYLGGSGTTGWKEDANITVTMECTVESMSQAAAMALALSQQ
jgi:hypothetical protein